MLAPKGRKLSIKIQAKWNLSLQIELYAKITSSSKLSILTIYLSLDKIKNNRRKYKEYSLQVKSAGMNIFLNDYTLKLQTYFKIK